MKKILVRSIRQIFTQSVHNAKQGEGWEASKVYQISVINFHYTKDDKNEMSWYTMKNEDRKKLAERLNIVNGKSKYAVQMSRVCYTYLQSYPRNCCQGHECTMRAGAGRIEKK